MPTSLQQSCDAHDAKASCAVSSQRASTLRRAAAACERVTRYIDANYTRPLTAKQLGEVAHMSEFHLQRAYVQSTGMNVAAHLRRRRIERAMRLLATTCRGLDRVALDSGLASASALVHLFARETGVTPGQFRREPDAVHRALARLNASDHARPSTPLNVSFQLLWRPAQPLLTVENVGMQARGFSHSGFQASASAMAHYAEQWPLERPHAVFAFYPDSAMGPDDPTARQVIGFPAPRSGTGLGWPKGFSPMTLPGGWYVRISAEGAHQYAWQRWRALLGGGLLSTLGLARREGALAFEHCLGYGQQGDGLERINQCLFIPVHAANDSPGIRWQQTEEDAAFKRLLMGGAMPAYERLRCQPDA